jgi:coatomer subunit alpha
MVAAENAFDYAMLNGNGFVPEEEAHETGDANAASAALDDWAAEDAAQEEEQGDGAWDLEGEEDQFVDADGEDLPGDVDLTPGASHGMSDPEFWVRNSPFAADHIAAGSFETAMQVGHRHLHI